MHSLVSCALGLEKDEGFCSGISLCRCVWFGTAGLFLGSLAWTAASSPWSVGPQLPVAHDIITLQSRRPRSQLLGLVVVKLACFHCCVSC